jgi:hypothetical protein
LVALGVEQRVESSFPNNGTVIRPDEFEIGEDSDELPRIRLQREISLTNRRPESFLSCQPNGVAGIRRKAGKRASVFSVGQHGSLSARFSPQLLAQQIHHALTIIGEIFPPSREKRNGLVAGKSNDNPPLFLLSLTRGFQSSRLASGKGAADVVVLQLVTDTPTKSESTAPRLFG